MTSVSQKIVQTYGIEVSEGIQWKGWEPGGEYTKQITLKNIQVKTQKIIYKVPDTRFFTTLYPKPVILTCGTSFTLPVTFRPLEKDQYEDKIEFQTKDGSFAVPIRAVLPKADLLVPKMLTFGMCAIKDTCELSFKLTNPSEVHTPFKWMVREPFSLSPSTGSLAPKTSCVIKATFSPKSGLVYNGTAVCHFGDLAEQMEKSVDLDGIGKYPHIMVRNSSSSVGQKSTTSNTGETLVEFATVAAGFTAEKTIHLHNLSPVNASFQVLQPSSISNLEKVFTCSQYHGIIAPYNTAKVKVQYAPTYPGTSHVEYFEVNVLGATNCSVIKCIGKSKGPSVMFDTSSLGFGQVNSGGTVTRILTIKNNSDVNTAFQFLIDKANSVFTFEATTGYLAAGSTQSIAVRFHPNLAINYYRKITCLLQNHAPLILEVFGTCHTELVKPAVLQQKHIAQYKIFAKRGLSRTSPDQLDVMFQEGELNMDDDGTLNNPVNADLKRCEDDLTCEEQFFDESSVGETATIQPHISVDHSQINFGKCPNIPCLEQKTINITNHTKGKVTCNWLKDTAGIFEISPESVDILPLKTASFIVTFKPDQANQFYGCEIECFISYKSTRDYRLVEDKTLSPPWCVTVYCSGETFSRESESFLPRLEFSATQLVFPAVTLQNTSYRTFAIANTSSNPVRFIFDRDPSGTFRCKPSQGIIRDNLQLVMLRYEALEMEAKKLSLCCHFNNEEKFDQEFTLIGSTESTRVHLEHELLYFRPTCVGNSSKRTFGVQNKSRIPISFEWRIRRQDSQILGIEPRQGTMLPGERQSFMWSFSPLEDKKYLIKCKLFVKVGGGVAEAKNVTPSQPYLLRAVGAGIHGSIMCTDETIDFDNVVVGTCATRKITLCNPTDCDVPYRLLLQRENNDDSYDDDDENKHVISVDKINHDVLPARTTKSIQVKARPRKRATYKTNIKYQVITLQDSVSESLVLCSVTVQGIYPTLAAQDIRSTGSGETYSKVQLWKLFSLDSFNSVLESDPQPVEALSSAATRYSDRRRKPVSTRAVIGFSFGSAGCGSQPTVFYLSLLNSGSVPAEWAFLFPNDLQLELEYWAETGEYSSEELHQMQTIGHHLFSVEPSSGTLAAGHAQTLTLKYKHDIVGINRLPVLFKITKGREVLLNFTGVTVKASQPFVHFSSTNFMFAPVPVGLDTPPIQDYAFYNGGSVNATYEIDLTPLKELHQENYGCEIFTCLNPTGTIAPGKTAIIHWVFEPLEAKTYIIDTPVRVLGCETTLVTFTGIGYDDRVMGKTLSLEEHAIDIPPRQIASVGFQLSSLSEERIHLGQVPLRRKKTRVIFLSNKHREHTISYRWMLDDSPEHNVVQIHPEFGIVKPRGSVVLKITFFSSGSPSLHDIDLMCEITDDTIMDEYNKKLQEWLAYQEEQKHLFTITEKDIAEEAMKKTKSKDEAMGRLSKSEGDLKKFVALPPIGSGKARNRARSGNENVKSPQVPVAPKTSLLHLSVTARTLEAGDVQIDRNMLAITSALMRKHTVRNISENKASMTSSSREERRVVTEVLSVVLRGLLDDENFHGDIRSVAEEPIPYFRQFQTVDAADGDDFCDVMDFDMICSSSKNIPIVTISPNTPTIESLSSRNEALEETPVERSINHINNEIKSSSEFATLAEEVLENTILNLMWEANLGEVNLTTRPRVIALPPSRGKASV
ncbi:cilia- and flagella-associated protein 65-like [Dendronephthya gigantea]|uniref:cilia- and flagella-associated protein 65-like n=1 Tax=Dendronephthya gigantea TaxID=151771 RepID=UPI00106B7D3B|nr:cilia- and flagella-associated protein 65-like [Dendronephthya gigantea]